MLNVIYVLLGIGLLVAGRKMFWLFVGAAGFLTGVTLVTQAWHGSEATAIILGIVLGLVFVALAIFFKSLGIAIAGFIGGGALFLSLAGWLGINSNPLNIALYIIGGIFGIIIVGKIFDWALIILSSMIGASLIVGSTNLNGPVGWLAMVALMVTGIFIQSRGIGEKEHKKNVK